MKITQTRDIRAANRWEIMHQVLEHSPISRVEICRRTGGFMGAEGGRISLRKPQRLPLRRAEDSGRKGGAMGAAEAFCHPGSVAEVAADAVYHDMPLFCKNSFADLHDKIGKI